MNRVFNLILVVSGILMMAYSSYISIKIHKIFSSGKHWFSFGGKFKRTWSILPVFILFFLAMYCLYLFHYQQNASVNYEVLSSIILFFGALFVLTIVYVNYKVFSIMQGRGAQ